MVCDYEKEGNKKEDCPIAMMGKRLEHITKSGRGRWTRK